MDMYPVPFTDKHVIEVTDEEMTILRRALAVATLSASERNLRLTAHSRATLLAQMYDYNHEQRNADRIK